MLVPKRMTHTALSQDDATEVPGPEIMERLRVSRHAD